MKEMKEISKYAYEGVSLYQQQQPVPNSQDVLTAATPVQNKKDDTT